MKEFLSRISLLIFIVAAQACVQVVDEEPQKEKDQGRKIRVHSEDESNELLKLNLHPEEELNQYSLILSFPPYPDFRVEKFHGDVAMGILEGVDGQIQDHGIRAGESYTYILIDHQGDELSRKEFRVPIDRIIDKELHLSGDENWSYGRLVLESNATIYTYSHKLKIQVDGLFSDGARIANFPEDFAYGEIHENLNGGDIQIASQQAYGDLEVFLNGQDGRHGADGSEDNKSLQGRAGKKGKDGKYQIRFSGFNDIRHYCLAPEDGAPGGTGKKGHPGENGQAGGDSGSLIFDVEDSETFYLSVKREPGIGGKPGKGGPGGPGGAGGKPGDIRSEKGKKLKGSKLCPVAKKGKDGKPGPMGDSGREGERGKERRICTRLNGAESFNCY